MNRTIDELLDIAYNVRKNVLRMGYVDRRGFIAQGIGAADFLTGLFFHAMRYHDDDPEWEGRDRFLLSAGHNAIAVYAAMTEAGILPEEWLDTYGLDGSHLPMASMPRYTPGIEISGGSIGLGLPIGVGVAMGLKRKNSDSKVYIMMGDGEMAEGPTWEAAISAGAYHLDNIIGLVDANGIQADGLTKSVIDTEPLDEKFRAFGFDVQRINGNSMTEVVTALDNARLSEEKKPHMIICNTVPGTGLSFLIGNPKSHFISLDDEGWERAFKELERGRE